jgi:hypothetical protein
MRLAPMTLDLQERIDEILSAGGIKTIHELMEHTFQNVVSTLKQKRIFSELFAEALEFVDPTPGHAWFREWRMQRQKETKLSVVKGMTIPQEVEVFTDFFTEKLGARILFANSLERMALSLKALRDELNTGLAGTSSIS